jgi:hypothetical protein
LKTLRVDIETVLGREKSLGEVPVLWDGRTACRIVRALIECAQRQAPLRHG